MELEDYDSEEEAYDNIIYPETSDNLNDKVKNIYKEFLIEVVENAVNNNKNPYNLDLFPLYDKYSSGTSLLKKNLIKEFDR